MGQDLITPKNEILINDRLELPSDKKHNKNQIMPFMKFDIEKLKNEILKQLPQIHQNQNEKLSDTKIDINNALL